MDRKEKSKESKFSQGVSPFFLPDNLLMHKGKMDCILLGTGPRLALSTSFSVTIDGKVLNRASKNKYLWNVLDPWLTWNAHVDYLVGNVRQRVTLLGPIMKNINMYVTGTVYTSFVLPILDYCDAVCSYCGSVNADRLEKIAKLGTEHVMCLGSSEKELTFLR